MKPIQGSQRPWACTSIRGYQRLYTTSMSLHYSPPSKKGLCHHHLTIPRDARVTPRIRFLVHGISPCTIEDLVSVWHDYSSHHYATITATCHIIAITTPLLSLPRSTFITLRHQLNRWYHPNCLSPYCSDSAFATTTKTYLHYTAPAAF